MFLRTLSSSGATLLLCSGALAQDAYVDFSKRVQQRLQVLAFYHGPINGDIGPNTQAALGLERREPQSAEAGATAQPADEATH